MGTATAMAMEEVRVTCMGTAIEEPDAHRIAHWRGDRGLSKQMNDRAMRRMAVREFDFADTPLRGLLCPCTT
jgi:hypothetical protein